MTDQESTGGAGPQLGLGELLDQLIDRAQDVREVQARLNGLRCSGRSSGPPAVW
jgi:hypothetical protein